MKHIQFNTGRLYQVAGQVIAVEYDPNTGIAKMSDHSRMLDYAYQLRRHMDNDREIAREVMRMYDAGAYLSDRVTFSSIKLDSQQPVFKIDVSSY